MHLPRFYRRRGRLSRPEIQSRFDTILVDVPSNQETIFRITAKPNFERGGTIDIYLADALPTRRPIYVQRSVSVTLDGDTKYFTVVTTKPDFVSAVFL